MRAPVSTGGPDRIFGLGCLLIYCSGMVELLGCCGGLCCGSICRYILAVHFLSSWNISLYFVECAFVVHYSWLLHYIPVHSAITVRLWPVCYYCYIAHSIVTDTVNGTAFVGVPFCCAWTSCSLSVLVTAITYWRALPIPIPDACGGCGCRCSGYDSDRCSLPIILTCVFFCSGRVLVVLFCLLLSGGWFYVTLIIYRSVVRSGLRLLLCFVIFVICLPFCIIHSLDIYRVAIWNYGICTLYIPGYVVVACFLRYGYLVMPLLPFYGAFGII